MTPYFNLYSDSFNVTRPAYTHSVMKVNSNAVYDVVCSEYDSETIGPILNELYGINATPESYPTFQSSTTALAEYIINYFPCTSSCTC